MKEIQNTREQTLNKNFLLNVVLMMDKDWVHKERKGTTKKVTHAESVISIQQREPTTKRIKTVVNRGLKTEKAQTQTEERRELLPMRRFVRKKKIKSNTFKDCPSQEKKARVTTEGPRVLHKRGIDRVIVESEEVRMKNRKRFHELMRRFRNKINFIVSDEIASRLDADEKMNRIKEKVLEKINISKTMEKLREKITKDVEDDEVVDYIIAELEVKHKKNKKTNKRIVRAIENTYLDLEERVTSKIDALGAQLRYTVPNIKTEEVSGAKNQAVAKSTGDANVEKESTNEDCEVEERDESIVTNKKESVDDSEEAEKEGSSMGEKKDNRKVVAKKKTTVKEASSKGEKKEDSENAVEQLNVENKSETTKLTSVVAKSYFANKYKKEILRKKKELQRKEILERKTERAETDADVLEKTELSVDKGIESVRPVFENTAGAEEDGQEIKVAPRVGKQVELSSKTSSVRKESELTDRKQAISTSRRIQQETKALTEIGSARSSGILGGNIESLGGKRESFEMDFCASRGLNMMMDPEWSVDAEALTDSEEREPPKMAVRTEWSTAMGLPATVETVKELKITTKKEWLADIEAVRTRSGRVEVTKEELGEYLDGVRDRIKQQREEELTTETKKPVSHGTSTVTMTSTGVRMPIDSRNVKLDTGIIGKAVSRGILKITGPPTTSETRTSGGILKTTRPQSETKVAETAGTIGATGLGASENNRVLGANTGPLEVPKIEVKTEWSTRTGLSASGKVLEGLKTAARTEIGLSVNKTELDALKMASGIEWSTNNGATRIGAGKVGITKEESYESLDKMKDRINLQWEGKLLTETKKPTNYGVSQAGATMSYSVPQTRAPTSYGVPQAEVRAPVNSGMSQATMPQLRIRAPTSYGMTQGEVRAPVNSGMSQAELRAPVNSGMSQATMPQLRIRAPTSYGAAQAEARAPTNSGMSQATMPQLRIRAPTSYGVTQGEARAPTSYGMPQTRAPTNYGMSQTGAPTSYGMPQTRVPTSYGMPQTRVPTNYGMSQTGAPTNYGMSQTGAPTNYGMSQTGAPTNYGMPQTGAPTNYGMSQTGMNVPTNYGMPGNICPSFGGQPRTTLQYSTGPMEMEMSINREMTEILTSPTNQRVEPNAQMYRQGFGIPAQETERMAMQRGFFDPRSEMVMTEVYGQQVEMREPVVDGTLRMNAIFFEDGRARGTMAQSYEDPAMMRMYNAERAAEITMTVPNDIVMNEIVESEIETAPLLREKQTEDRELKGILRTSVASWSEGAAGANLPAKEGFAETPMSMPQREMEETRTWIGITDETLDANVGTSTERTEAPTHSMMAGVGSGNFESKTDVPRMSDGNTRNLRLVTGGLPGMVTLTDEEVSAAKSKAMEARKKMEESIRKKEMAKKETLEAANSTLKEEKPRVETKEPTSRDNLETNSGNLGTISLETEGMLSACGPVEGATTSINSGVVSANSKIETVNSGMATLINKNRETMNLEMRGMQGIPTANNRMTNSDSGIPSANNRMANSDSGIPSANNRMANTDSGISETRNPLLGGFTGVKGFSDYRIAEANRKLEESRMRMTEAARKVLDASSGLFGKEISLLETEKTTNIGNLRTPKTGGTLEPGMSVDVELIKAKCKALEARKRLEEAIKKKEQERDKALEKEELSMGMPDLGNFGAKQQPLGGMARAETQQPLGGMARANTQPFNVGAKQQPLGGMARANTQPFNVGAKQQPLGGMAKANTQPFNVGTKQQPLGGMARADTQSFNVGAKQQPLGGMAKAKSQLFKVGSLETNTEAPRTNNEGIRTLLARRTPVIGLYRDFKFETAKSNVPEATRDTEESVKKKAMTFNERTTDKSSLVETEAPTNSENLETNTDIEDAIDNDIQELLTGRMPAIETSKDLRFQIAKTKALEARRRMEESIKKREMESNRALGKEESLAGASPCNSAESVGGMQLPYGGMAGASPCNSAEYEGELQWPYAGMTQNRQVTGTTVSSTKKRIDEFLQSNRTMLGMGKSIREIIALVEEYEYKPLMFNDKQSLEEINNYFVSLPRRKKPEPLVDSSLKRIRRS